MPLAAGRRSAAQQPQLSPLCTPYVLIMTDIQAAQQSRKHACFIPCIYLKNGPCWQDFLTAFSVLQVMNRRVWCNQGMHAHIRIFAMVVQEAVLCVPMDRRLPLLRLRSRHLLPLVKQRFVVRVDTWPRDSKHPTCHFVRSLGALNDMRCALSSTLATVRGVASPCAALAKQCCCYRS